MVQLPHELIQRSIWEKENSILSDRIGVLRNLGYSDDEIRQLIWSLAGKSLAKLGTHQDSGMVLHAEVGPKDVAESATKSEMKP
jgi:hypothetical protein